MGRGSEFLEVQWYMVSVWKIACSECVMVSICETMTVLSECV